MLVIRGIQISNICSKFPVYSMLFDRPLYSVSLSAKINPDLLRKESSRQPICFSTEGKKGFRRAVRTCPGITAEQACFLRRAQNRLRLHGKRPGE